jgi:cellulose synthase/poly-beta-1,6-N-acetylglucosamine synthase-like glycosyltransferase
MTVGEELGGSMSSAEAMAIIVCATSYARPMASADASSVDLAVENPVHAVLGEVERRLGSRAEIELSILMPCLNEAETLAVCIEKATGFLRRSGIAGEVIVADNGSTDASRDIARALGARVVEVAARGYGAALSAGIATARGRYVIMGDSDDSYDFAELDGFLASPGRGPRHG